MKGLTQELGAALSRVDSVPLAAGTLQRGNAREGGELCSRVPALGVAPKSAGQSGSQHRSGSRQVLKNLPIGMGFEKLSNLFIVASNIAEQAFELARQHLDP